MQISGGKLFQAKAQRRLQGGNRCGMLEEAQGSQCGLSGMRKRESGRE